MPLDRSRPGSSRTFPALAYQADPIRQSLRFLGRKWTLLLIRDLAFLHLDRFVEFVHNNPGLTPRVLSRRLKELQREGLVDRGEDSGRVRYRLTPKGEDAVYILLAFLRFGLKHHLGPQPPSGGGIEGARGLSKAGRTADRGGVTLHSSRRPSRRGEYR